MSSTGVLLLTLGCMCLFVYRGVEGQSPSNCPPQCVCYGTNSITVRCLYQRLERIPAFLPVNTAVLDLRFNNIQHIPRNAISGYGRLNTILLNNNHIKTIASGAFNNLRELRLLYLYKNEITKIERQAFIHLPKLKEIFLHSNNITSLPEGIVTDSPLLQRIRLEYNPLHCDCNLRWMLQRSITQNGHVQVVGTCLSPAALQGRQFHSLQFEDLRCVAPTIVRGPTDITLQTGEDARFSCQANGVPSPTITWLHNERPVDLRTSRFHQSDDGTLYIRDTEDGDKGTYECMAVNSVSHVQSGRAFLRFLGNYIAPTLSRLPSDVTVMEGHMAMLVCEAQGFPDPTIRWHRGSNEIYSDHNHRVYDNGTLVIPGTQLQDEGAYRCTASNTMGTMFAEANLHVMTPPRIVRAPSNMESVEGGTTLFFCQASGTPVPSITWLKDGEEVRTGGDRIEVKEGGSMLRISPVIRSDQGRYTCRVSNGHGDAEALATLTITLPPQTHEFLSNTEVKGFLGSDSLLECETEDFSTEYRWIKDGSILRTSPKYTFQRNRLIIHNVEWSDAGKYECFAANTVGFNRKALLLVIEGDSRRVQTQVPLAIETPINNAYYDTDVVREALREARNRVNSAVNETMEHLFDRSRQHTVQELTALFRYPSAEALELARAEEIFEQTLDIVYRHVREGHEYNLTDRETFFQDIISPGHLTLIANMSGCFANPRVTQCENMCYHRKYRSMDGSCNNFQHPLWGASVTPLKRLVAPIYENGFNTPVGWTPSKLYNGFHLPSPRLVSSFLMSTDHVTQDELNTHMLMQWGQFLDHDMDLTPQSISYARFSDGRRCNETCDNAYPCFPINVPRSDPRIQSHACIGFSRSSATCSSGSTSIFYKTFAPREQLNAITSFIDASNVYGSSEFDIQRLRELSNSRGLMREGALSNNRKRLLPFDNGGFLDHADCQIDPRKRHIPCFRAGDNRANEQNALTAMHTLWMRHHNHIATELGKINPHWDGNMVFHETRKIIGAIMQHITYYEWLPNIVGPQGMEMLGTYRGYDDSIDPGVSNEFATAAFRFGHSLVQPILFRLNASFQPIPEGNLMLHHSFFSPHRILEEGGIDPLLRGLFARSAKKRMPDEIMNSELTEKLFSLSSVAADLAALNIQRGRDHGLPFYNKYRQHCNLTYARSFRDFSNEITDPQVLRKLEAVYNHHDNVDLFVGGMAETPLPGAKVGPTFMCIIVDQFRRTRDGDRFWYENTHQWSQEQVNAIKQASLARVVCDSGDQIDRVQEDIFIRAENDSQYLPCHRIKKINLQVWEECCTDCHQAGNFQSITGEFQRVGAPQQSLREERDHILLTETHDTQSDMAYIQTEMTNMKDDMSRFTGQLTSMQKHVDELLNSVKYIRRKMRRMNRHMRRMATQQTKCETKSGETKQEGDTWLDEVKCRTCICRHGSVSCRHLECPLPQCDNPQKVKGQCCPGCS